MKLTEAQQGAVSSPETGICIIAGAGTGKTTVLVERFIHLVTGPTGAGIDEVLAITFTEKAALEMKQKVLQRLSEMGLDDLKREAESAYISTIHGFCTRILLENPVEAGVDPTFDVMDEVASATYIQQALDFFFQESPVGLQELLQLYEEDFIAQTIRSAIRRYRSMGYPTNNFIPLVDRIGSLEKIIAAKNRELSRLAADIKELTETLEEWCTIKSLEDKRQEVVGLTSALDSSSPDVNIIKEIRKSCTHVSKKVPKDADPEAYSHVADVLIEIKERCDDRKWLMEVDENLEREADRHRQWFNRAAHEVLKCYDSYKDERQALDFEDLQLRVKELFARHPSILRRYRDKFKAILVDEYQDVNRLQAELIETLSGGNNLFAVGDPKQLIYEFRDADLQAFFRFCETAEREGRSGTYILDQSFRSRQDILDFINPFFQTLWEGTGFPYHPIHRKEGKHPPKEVPSVEIIVSPQHKEEKLDVAREAEAQAVASRIQEMVALPSAELDRWGRKEPFSYGDIAVLFRASSGIKVYEDVLKARGIPYSVSKGSGFFQSREFADALSLLQVIDNAQQDIPMAAVLRSPFVGVNEDTLFLLRASAEEGENRSPLSGAIYRSHEIDGLEPAEQEKLRRFADLFSGLRAGRGRAAPDELLETALRETAYEAKILSHTDGMQKLANIRKMLQFLRELQYDETEDLSRICRFLETARRSDISEKEAPLEPEGGNAVNLTTIHGAKGLEFPVVVLADMGRKFHSGGKEKGIYVSGDYGICCKHRHQDGREAETLGYHLSRARQKERQLAEEQRLLYVAMTRAGEHLIMAGSGDFSRKAPIHEATSPMQAVCAALEINFQNEEHGSPAFLQSDTVRYHHARVKVSTASGTERVHGLSKPPTLAERYKNEIASGLRITDVHADGKMIESVAERLNYTEKPLPEKPLAISITGLLEYRQCPARYYFKHRLGLPEEETFLPCNESQTSGAEFGSKVHTMLNLIDFGKDLAAQMPALLHVADLHPNAHDEAEKLLSSFTSCKLFAELKASDNLHRELPFSLKLGEATLRGVMDALFQKGDQRWALLDYKTDDVNLDDATIRAEGYFFQLSLYALAVHRILGLVPQTVMLYFLRPNKILEREMREAQLESVKEEAIGLVARIRAEDFPPVKSPRCYSCAYGRTFCKTLESQTASPGTGA